MRRRRKGIVRMLLPSAEILCMRLFGISLKNTLPFASTAGPSVNLWPWLTRLLTLSFNS